MAEQLKHFFDARVVGGIADRLRGAGLEVGDFEARAVAGLDRLELMDRGRHIAAAMRAVLPAEGGEALRTLVRCFGPRHAKDELIGSGMAAFAHLPDTFVISELGVTHPVEGLAACEEVTKRFTAEFCLRPILEAHPEVAWAAIDRWVAHADPHVRRLASEGTRPRLPWGTRLRALQEDPSPAIARLDRLVDDPAELVRRSVANHLGDIAKDHPDLAVATARRWLADRTPEREKLVRHGLRHLIKQGHPGALGLLGFGGAAARVEGFTVPEAVTLGDAAPYSFDVVSDSDAPQRLVVDVVVHFRKARDKTSPKVFKAATFELAPGARQRVSGKVRTHAMSTRSHFPGVHRVEVQINGERRPGGSFDLRAGPAAPSEADVGRR